MQENFRPAAVPLITNDPYFSIWSMSDRLYDDYPRHWTLKRKSLCGMLHIDGQCWRFLGKTRLTNVWRNRHEPPGMEQISLTVNALSTIYTFAAAGIELKVSFTTPLLLDKPEILSRPCSYVAFSINSADGKNHNVSLYFDVSAELCVNDRSQKVVFAEKTLAGNQKAMYMGSKDQNILGHRGDFICIDWGYLYHVPVKASEMCIGPVNEIRRSFIQHKTIIEHPFPPLPKGYDVGSYCPVMGSVYHLQNVTAVPVEGLIVLAYDDVYSIEYFNKPLKPYCFKDGNSFEKILEKSVKDYSELKKQCDLFDKNLLLEAENCGGKKYSQLLALAYRQSIAAHKLVCDDKGNMLFLSKECTSNGCICTVDVSYPSMPLYLLYNPEFAKAMLVPIFHYADMDVWDRDFAPHDVGIYPRANGQEYGVGLNGVDDSRQMPVEECGNMLIMTMAVCFMEGSPDFAGKHIVLLEKWAEYLIKKGFDPENQLCTDDFAGHLAHNTNLSIKAILGIACFAEICQLLDRKDDYRNYREKALMFAAEWEKMAYEDDHYKLTFTDKNTWSLKYNLIWDKLFDLNIFPEKIVKKEIAFYLKNQNKFGIPLDSRAMFTKSDWLTWAAALAESKQDFISLVEPLWDFVHRTPNRTPFCDWYCTVDAIEQTFHNRSVVGGIFIRLLKSKLSGKSK